MIIPEAKRQTMVYLIAPHAACPLLSVRPSSPWVGVGGS